MRTRLCILPAASCLFLVAAAVQTLRAEAPPVAANPEDKNKKLTALIEESVQWYQLLPEAGSKQAMHPQPVLRWRNDIREQEGTAMMVAWIHDGRPEVIGSIYPWKGYLCHEFVSVSRGNKLVAKDQEQVVWSPAQAGIEFHDVPNAPAPADTAAARLRQMKSLSERFQATMTGWKGDNSDREELRLLPRPLYRYEIKAGTESRPLVQDGAVFAFVQGTDPEVLMLLEAVRQGDRSRWQYGFARATSGGLEARLGGQVVWSAGKFANTQVRTLPQMTVRRLLDE